MDILSTHIIVSGTQSDTTFTTRYFSGLISHPVKRYQNGKIILPASEQDYVLCINQNYVFFKADNFINYSKEVSTDAEIHTGIRTFLHEGNPITIILHNPNTFDVNIDFICMVRLD